MSVKSKNFLVDQTMLDFYFLLLVSRYRDRDVEDEAKELVKEV